MRIRTIESSNTGTHLTALLLCVGSVVGCNWLPSSSKGKSTPDDVDHRASIQAVDPIEQLIIWETKANVAEFREPTADVKVSATRASNDQIDVEWLGDPGPSLKSFVQIGDDESLWPKHPFNTSAAVPFLKKEVDPSLGFKAFFSASRSLFFFADGGAYTIKMPTNYPHKGVYQPTKAEMGKESRLTVPFSKHIADVEEQTSKDPDLLILRDIAMVVEKSTSNGYTIRDLRPLQSTGNYYFPGFSFDTSGVEVIKACTGAANVTSAEFAEFWSQHYSFAAGRAKATLLLKYGILQSTPNAQNWLIELDRKTMCPTGKMVIRDIVDAKPVLSIAQALGYMDFVNEWSERGGHPTDTIILNEEHTLWQSTLQHNSRALQAQRDGFMERLRGVLDFSSDEITDSFPLDAQAIATRIEYLAEKKVSRP